MPAIMAFNVTVHQEMNARIIALICMHPYNKTLHSSNKKQQRYPGILETI